MLTDYHMHTILSDGKDEHETIIQAAINKGFDEIGFTDHICHILVDWRMEPDLIPLMIEKIQTLKHKFRDKINIKFGIEVDFIPGDEQKIADTISQIAVDYVIGSIHYIGNWNYDSDPSKFEDKSIYQLYELYFQTIQESARSGLFDIIGHPDLIKKYGYYPEEDITSLYKDTAAVFKNSNVVIELNTNGKNKACKDFYPALPFLKICHNYGVPITLSSDAHKAKLVGQYFNEAISLLRQTGYQKIAIFNKRKRSFIDLP